MKPMLSTKQAIDPAILLAEAKVITEKLVRSVDPVKVICFGSVATGQTTDQSDIDLLVILDSFTNIMEARRQFLPFRKGYKRPLDLVWMNTEDFERKKYVGGIAMIAAEDGVVLYERKGDARNGKR